MTTQVFKSDADLKSAIVAACPLVSFRYAREWNEYQITPTGRGYDAPETSFIDKGHDPASYTANRADAHFEAVAMQARLAKTIA